MKAGVITKPELEHEDVEQILTIWLHRLKLTHWDIKIDWDKPPAPDSEAEYAVNEWYDQAIIKISPEFTKWTRRDANLTIVHELVHLMQRGLAQACESLESSVKKEAWQVWGHRYEYEIEGLVERTAQAFVELGGVV